MLALVFYFIFGYLVMLHGRPVQFAGAYAVSASLLSLFVGAGVLEVLLSGAILFGYTAFVYMVVDRYNESVLAPICILVAGALILVGAAFAVG